jgi:hypothetical protein
MAEKRRGGGRPLPEEPEARVQLGLPAAIRIWESETAVHCNIWWGREQEAGRRLYRLSRQFPYPSLILKGGGVFEEILYLLTNLEVEIYTIGPKRGGINEYSDYLQALGRIENATVNAVIEGGIYEGKDPEHATVLTMTIDFLKN